MSTAANPLVENLLILAEELANHRGGRNLQQAAVRRAISTAYYALFHSLCYVCSDGLVRWSRVHLVQRVYRSLDHAVAKRRLIDPAAFDIHPNIREIGSALRELQDQRHLADYEPPGHMFTRAKALALVHRSRDAVDLMQQLDADSRTQLAIFLLVSKRPI